jgi:hypothetical protein
MKQNMKTGSNCKGLFGAPFFNGIKIGLMQLYFTVKALPFEIASCETFASEN